MLVSRVSSRLPKGVLAHCRNSLLLYARRQQLQQHHLPILSNQFHSLRESPKKVVVTSQVPVLHHSIFNTSAFQRYGIFSSASPQPTEKDNAQSRNEQGGTIEDNGAAGFGEADGPAQKEESDSLANLSIDDLSKLVAEKEELLKLKHKEMEKMQDKVLRSYAEMENVMDRTKREAESSKKFAIQNFAKSLLDVADNLGRAASVVKGSFSKIDTSTDSAGAVPLLNTLLEGVEMTDKQLAEVFKKFGVEKFDPTNEQFDPHKHNAVFQVPDATRPPETVAVVLKSGYMLYDRVIRPAEVGVTVGNRMVD